MTRISMSLRQVSVQSLKICSLLNQEQVAHIEDILIKIEMYLGTQLPAEKFLDGGARVSETWREKSSTAGINIWRRSRSAHLPGERNVFFSCGSAAHIEHEPGSAEVGGRPLYSLVQPGATYVDRPDAGIGEDRPMPVLSMATECKGFKCHSAPFTSLPRPPVVPPLIRRSPLDTATLVD